MFIAVVGVALLVLVPIVWGFLRRGRGLPMLGTPTVAEIEDLTAEKASTSAGTSAQDLSVGT